MTTLNNHALALLDPNLNGLFDSQQQGLPRGHLFNIWGFPHTHKTNLATILLAQAVKSNPQKVTASGKRPCILIVVSEHTVESISELLHTHLPNDALVSEYGWNIYIKKVDVTQPVSAEQYMEIVAEAEGGGVEVVASMVDVPAFTVSADLDKAISERNAELGIIAKETNQVIFTTNGLPYALREELKNGIEALIDKAPRSDQAGTHDLLTMPLYSTEDKGMLKIACMQTGKCVTLDLRLAGVTAI